MLVLAVTLHNIPEGMAVGVSFALSAKAGASVPLASAIALAIGIGLQNFPEGAAISLPLHKEGVSKSKAFLYGSFSGIVELIAGVATVAIAGTAVYIPVSYTHLDVYKRQISYLLTIVYKKIVF